MPYQYLRYVYYTGYTGHALPPVGMTGSPTLREEATRRADRMVGVLNFARQQIPGLGPQNPVSGMKDSEILKIFVAPEFVFRSSVGAEDGTSQYSLLDVQAIREIIRAALLRDSGFEDWLVVPGTVIYSQDRANAQNMRVIFNELWAVSRSSTGTDPRVDVVSQKQYFAVGDGLNASNAALVTGGALATLASYVNHQIITMGGRTIGMEICLDHDLGALKKTVLKPLTPTRLDVHLLTACGMATNDASVAARSNGYFLRCNGNTYAPPPYQCFQVGRWPGGPGALPAAGVSPPLKDLAKHLHTQALPKNLQISGLDEQVGYSDVLPFPP
jgi:hypothetical protein